MAFTVNDYQDLVRLLAEHPEWRSDLRRLVLSEELLSLPEIVRELAEAQRRTEQKIEELAEAQRRTEQKVEELAEAQRRTEERLVTLEQRMVELIEVVKQLAEAQHRAQDTLGDLKGRMLEWTYREKPYAYFGRILKRIAVVSLASMEEQLEGNLPRADFEDLIRVDLLVRGQPRDQPEQGDVLLAVEVSSVIDHDDVVRADRRAALLRRLGYHTIAVAAGLSATLGAVERARQSKVVLMQDGVITGWEEALS